MKAVILCAGTGTRLRPYTLSKPKCLVELDGHSLIERQIQVLNYSGIDNITFIGGYLSNELSKFTKDSPLIVNEKFDSTNMLYSLGLWLKTQDSFDDDVLISYGDIVYSASILESLKVVNDSISVVVDINFESYWNHRTQNPLDDLESLSIDTDGSIKNIGQPIDKIENIDAQYIGLIKLSKSSIQSIQDEFIKLEAKGFVGDKRFSDAYMTDFLQYLIDANYTITACKTESDWLEIDTVEDLHNPISIKRAYNIKSQIISQD